MTENIETLLKESRVYRPTAKTIAAAHIKDYEKDYQKSIADPEAFWSGLAKELDWFSPWSTVLECNYPWAKWFVGATCNIPYNCLDRHVKTWRKNKVALIWVGEDDRERIFTYGELYRQVNRCANALKKLGLNTGDRVTIYLPKIPEQLIAMLACARIGVIHSVVYSGFSAPALARIGMSMNTESLHPPWSGMNSRSAPSSVKPLFAARTTSLLARASPVRFAIS
jgi:acetyl-CoA synthetase